MQLISGPNKFGGVAVDASSVYWADETGVRKLALSGGAPVTLCSTPGKEPKHWKASLAIDATSVYCTSTGAILWKRAAGFSAQRGRSTLFAAHVVGAGRN